MGVRNLGASETNGMSTVSQASKWLPDLQLCILESFFLLEKAAIDIHTAAPLKLFGPFQTGDSFSTNLEASMYCLLSSASPTEVRPHKAATSHNAHETVSCIMSSVDGSVNIWLQST